MAQDLGTGSHKLVGQQQALPLQSLRQLAGLAARGGAKVRHLHAGVYIQQRGRGRSAGLLGIEHPRVVPGMAAGLKVRRGGKGRGAERRQRSGEIRMGGEPLRRAAQTVDRKARAQQCLLPRGKISRKLHTFPLCIKKPWAGKLPLRPEPQIAFYLRTSERSQPPMAKNQTNNTTNRSTQKTTNRTQQKTTNRTTNTTNTTDSKNSK